MTAYRATVATDFDGDDTGTARIEWYVFQLSRIEAMVIHVSITMRTGGWDASFLHLYRYASIIYTLILPKDL